ncbi:MAG: tetratricopeptide repeat protein, partial [Spirochaetales bacterium]|nr:tetratricopeptide repeat protein [Spirochaetales bacterium]
KDLSTAGKYYRRADSVARKIKSKPFIASVCLGITSLYLEKNNLVKAEKELNSILCLSEEIGSKGIKAHTLCLSGRLYTKQKKWDKAKSSFEESMLIFKKLRKKVNLAQVYYYQGIMFKESEDKANAKKCFTKALGIFKKLGAKGWIKKLKK